MTYRHYVVDGTTNHFYGPLRFDILKESFLGNSKYLILTDIGDYTKGPDSGLF